MGRGGDGLEKFGVLIPDNVCLTLTVMPRVAYTARESGLRKRRKVMEEIEKMIVGIRPSLHIN